MKVTSKTGLLPTSKTTSIIYPKRPPVHLKALAGPAPYTLKPFAGLYNPYPYGCSLLCNHPADTEAKDLVKRAKNTWATEGKSLLLAEEVAAIRAGLEQLQTSDNINPSGNYEFSTNVESVPEELFRRYTETDSRPLTPAPTIISIRTKTSGSRRCVTPDPMMATSEVREKTQLILDLRRSHSQETLSWFGSSQQTEPPIIRIQQVPTRAASPESCIMAPLDKRKSSKTLHPPLSTRRPKSGHSRPQDPKINLDAIAPKVEVHAQEEFVTEEQSIAGEDDQENGVIKRRGKKRRKRGRDSSAGLPGFQSSVDPETQVATIDDESHNPSARPSLIPGGENLENEVAQAITERKSSLDINSFLDREILRQLRRELTEEIVDNEFNFKRRRALEEAMKTISTNKTLCDELLALQKELRIPAINAEFWLSLPRVFSRSSARFELPIDSREFSRMKPLDYIKDNVIISSSRKLLYNCIFNRNKVVYEEDEAEQGRKISGKQITHALGEMMGKPLSERQALHFHELMGWSAEDTYDFKTFCGLCALCERLLALEYYPQLPSQSVDPCHEIEVTDFESLERKVRGQNIDSRLLKVLHAIKNS